jgi:hypothetical protein
LREEFQASIVAGQLKGLRDIYVRTNWFGVVSTVGTSFLANANPLTNRKAHYLSLLARLKPGVTIQQAQAEMSNIASSLRREFIPWVNAPMK